MSRWYEQFENHKFQEDWAEIREAVKGLSVIDKADIQSLNELARLKKIVQFVDDMISGCDPELVPKSVWDQVQGESKSCSENLDKFESTPQIQYLQTANSHMDNILSTVRPHTIGTGNTGRSMQASLREFTKTIKKTLTEFKDDAAGILDQIGEFEKSAKTSSQSARQKYDEISSLYSHCFDDEEEPGVKTQISKLVADLEEKNEAIHEYHAELFDGDSDEDSIRSRISSALSSAIDDAEKVEAELQASEKKLVSLKQFYGDVYGYEDEDGEQIPGLKQEIELRKQAINTYETEQKQKLKDLINQVEDLMPGAISAGLASAFRRRKEIYDATIKSNTSLFYLAIGLLVAVALYLAFPYLLFAAKSSSTPFDWGQFGSSLLVRVPLFLPLAWLAVFVSRRRNQAQRLQEEYAHKEAVASSYSSFKTQIEEVGGEETELLSSLLDAAIQTISYNASVTLDGKHSDGSPIEVLLDRGTQLVSKKKVEIPGT